VRAWGQRTAVSTLTYSPAIEFPNPVPRRILLLITDLQIGGTPTVVRELAVRLREPRRVEVEVACLAGWGPVADQLRDAGVPVTALGAASVAALPRTLWRLVRLVHGRRYDNVFSFLVHANALAALASLACPGVRFLQSIQTTQPNPRWHWRVQRLAAWAADKVVVPSPSAAAVARRWAGVPAADVVVIPNAVDFTAFDAIYRRNVGRVPTPPFRVGFLGRLDPVKRVPDLLRAMAGAPDVHVHLFGDGADRRRIETEVERLGMASAVTLHGTVARPADALADLDVLVLPSEAEGFGLVLIEAMAAGVPVVATDVPGIRDVVADSRTGLLVPVGDRVTLRAAIVASAAPDGVRQRLIPTARLDVERRFGWPAAVAPLRQVLRL
jgi:glycosyltransferase involved in cell wall biosynthesis